MNASSLSPRAPNTTERPLPLTPEATAGAEKTVPTLPLEEAFAALVEKSLQDETIEDLITAAPESAPSSPLESVVTPLPVFNELVPNELAQPFLTPAPTPSILTPESELTATAAQTGLEILTPQTAITSPQRAGAMSEPAPAEKPGVTKQAAAEPFSALLKEPILTDESLTNESLANAGLANESLANESDTLSRPEPLSATPQQPTALTRLTEPSQPTQPAPALPVPIMALPAAIGIKALEGSQRFDIRLDPEDLGRVDIALEIDQDGGIRAAIAVEKPEALQLIIREARTLEQAFDQAGFRRDENALSFSLSDHGQSSQNPSDRPERRAMTRMMVEGDADQAQPLEASLMRTHGRLDMRI